MKLLKYWLLVALLFSGPQASAVSLVKNLRVWPSPETTRIVLDVSKKVKYSVSTISAPERIVIDIDDTRLATKLTDVDLSRSGITKIRYGVHPHDKLRIVLDVEQKFKVRDFILAPNERYGHRLVLDLELNDQSKILALFEPRPEPEAKTKFKIKPKVIATKNGQQPFVIALDAGHGGDDPGAIGPNGTKEKDIALAIAKQLKEIIDQQPGMQAVLIRNGDYYVGFRERMRRARVKNADLFISIHADAYPNKKANGASVFTLATNKSSSVAARWLAASENRSDLVGGLSLHDRGDMVTNVLFDLSQTANFAASAEAAKHVLHALGQTTSLHKEKVESGGFLVLRSPDIPSILVEAGFISNSKMELKLKNKEYQQQIANSIFNGIKQYFKNKQRRVS